MNLLVLIMFAGACKEVWGLCGGFGKGVWSESSSYMIEARNFRVQSFIILIFATVLNVIYWMIEYDLL